MKSCKRQMYAAGVLAIFWLFVGLGCAGSEKKPSPEMDPSSQTAPQMNEPPLPSPTMKTAPKAEPPADHYVHEVKWPGESLSIIAGWYTGDIQNWKALAPVNPHIKPSVIRMGDRIMIPRSMMKTQEPMPRSFLETFVPQAGGQSQPSSSKDKPTQDEPKLFGPKPLPKK